MRYSSEAISEREIVWRYLNKIKEKPKINNIPLFFSSYEIGYLDFDFFKKIDEIKNYDEKTIAEIAYSSKQPKTMLKKYFIKIFDKINNLPAKYFSTKLWMFIHDTNDLPKCELCGNSVKERRDFSIFRFCSQQCAKENISLRSIETAKNIYGNDWNKLWNSYKYIVIRLTEYSYKKYKDIINPLKLNRKRNEFHLDHKIPKMFGFLNKINPKIISHYKNLQMLTETENCSKQDKIILNGDKLLKEIESDLLNDDYFERKLK